MNNTGRPKGEEEGFNAELKRLEGVE